MACVGAHDVYVCIPHYLSIPICVLRLDNTADIFLQMALVPSAATNVETTQSCSLINVDRHRHLMALEFNEHRKVCVFRRN